jgi:5-methylcytosine-specific restriction endonuclease McrA
MKNHTKVYINEMGYDTTDFISCEVCGKKAVDIHHIQARGMGGSKLLDTIDNLMALCRECHHEADFGTKLPKESLKAIHTMRMAGL